MAQKLNWIWKMIVANRDSASAYVMSMTYEGFHKMRVPQKLVGLFHGKSHNNGWELGVPPIWGNLHLENVLGFWAEFAFKISGFWNSSKKIGDSQPLKTHRDFIQSPFFHRSSFDLWGFNSLLTRSKSVMCLPSTSISPGGRSQHGALRHQQRALGRGDGRGGHWGLRFPQVIGHFRIRPSGKHRKNRWEITISNGVNQLFRWPFFNSHVSLPEGKLEVSAIKKRPM